MRRGTKLRTALGVLVLFGTLLQVGHTETFAPSPPDAEPVQQKETPVAVPKRLLVIAPHPDDESLAGAWMIRRTLEGGGQVRVALMTNGDGFRKAASVAYRVDHPQARHLYQLGLLRQQELLAAVKQFGLQHGDVDFLGFPDAGMHHLWDSYWNPPAPYRSLAGADRVPYDLSHDPHLPYCGQAVIQSLSKLIDTYHPTDILYPDPHDVHGDHWATSAFVQYTLAGSPRRFREWTYLIHYPNFPHPRVYQPLLPLLPPTKVTGVGIDWHSLPLTDGEIQAKHNAVLSHRSQINVMRDLLLSFVRQNELVGTYTTPTVPLVQEDTRPFQSTHPLPYQILTDPAGDQSGTDPAADILRVGAVLLQNRLLICAETAADARSDLDYVVRLRLPHAPPGRTRLDLFIQSNRPSDPNVSVTSFPRVPAYATRQNRRMTVSLPVEALNDENYFLLSIEIYRAKKMQDNTAWRYFKIGKKPGF